MCGIAGFVAWPGWGGDSLRPAIARMVAEMIHRGPDGQRAVIFPAAEAAMGAARLALVDVSKGQQPIANEDGSVWAVLNGEIYNFEELRENLRARGHQFRSGSDTEVLVHLYEEKGEGLFAELKGMFAAAVFDLRERALLLGRDHAGMKPLFYAEKGGGIAFASDVRALFAAGAIEPEADWEQLDRFLDYAYVPAPGSVFRGVSKLTPGTYLRWQRGKVQRQRYWTMPVALEPYDPGAPLQLETLLLRAVRTHLQGDVEVGCLLSGGWDSSLVAAMAKAERGKLKTFSLVTPEHPDVDEQKHSRAVAAYLGTEHYEVEQHAAQLPRLLEENVWKLEEPSSCCPHVLMALVTRLAASHVKAVVGGEGADELLAGYSWLRSNVGYRLNGWVPKWLVRRLLPWSPDLRWRRVGRQLLVDGREDLDFEHVRRRVEWPGARPPWVKAERPKGADAYAAVGEQIGEAAVREARDPLQRRLLLEYGGRLTGGILYANDRIGMADGLEIRTPFLDRDVVEFAFRQPAQWKLRRGREKVMLRPLVEKYVPVVVQRRKQGLAVPLADRKLPGYREFVREVLLDPNSLFPRQAMEEMLRTREAGEDLTIQPLVVMQLWWNLFLAPGSRGRELVRSKSIPEERVECEVRA